MSEQSPFFVEDLVLLVLDNSIGHMVHESLSSVLSGLHLGSSFSFLLLNQSSVFSLSLDFFVLESLSFLLKSNSSIFVINEHMSKSFLLLQSSDLGLLDLVIDFILDLLDQHTIHLLLSFGFELLSHLLIVKLLVTGSLLGHDLFLSFTLFGSLTFIIILQVLGEDIHVVHEISLFLLLNIILLSELLIQFPSDLQFLFLGSHLLYLSFLLGELSVIFHHGGPLIIFITKFVD
mmetsp:Transcript_32617/g.29482  ORF Transcript_32617/g.29482 Transcript_32617/m.29482 type:complete len:233 (-) Transcript_32617:539-1237(-)